MNKGKLIFLIVTAICLTIDLQAQIKEDNGLQQNPIFESNTTKYLNVDDDNLKSRKTAILLGMGVTSIPIITNAVVNSDSQNSSLLALITGPLWIVGPSSGLIYAENYRSAANGSLIRLGGVASIGIGAIAILNGSTGLGALIIAFGAVVNITVR